MTPLACPSWCTTSPAAHEEGIHRGVIARGGHLGNIDLAWGQEWDGSPAEAEVTAFMGNVVITRAEMLELLVTLATALAVTW